MYIPEAKVKFVNAVLRRLTREGPKLLAETNVMDNVAPWLVQEFYKTYGEEATQNIVQSAMQESPRCLTLKHDPHATDTEKQTKLQHLASHFNESLVLPQGSLLVVSSPLGKVSHWPLYEQGEWWLQDVSATLPAIALDNALRQQKQQQHGTAFDGGVPNVVDLCAAPGGKTAQLCTMGYNVTAVEISKRRSQRLRENMHRLRLDCNIVIANGSEWNPEFTFEGVLVDAPCTATGTGSKRPDVLRKPQDYNELLVTQYNLLCHAADTLLAPGGILVYATCSLLPQESEDQIVSFLKRHNNNDSSSSIQMQTLPFVPGEIPGFEDCIDTKNGWLRIVPGSRPRSIPHVDGFFVARLQRKA
jgi:16S rRNA (cytosine967-C5)-methyltransferase